ncbi:hypothetical protein [Streptomyces endophytica]|uniref:hypothetical protein n=1 Tax=Streptomyces endophytica TaxID=2991496 RepID=UPI003C6FF6FD
MPAGRRQRLGQGVPGVREARGAVAGGAVQAHTPLGEQDGVAAAGRRPDPGECAEHGGLAQPVTPAAAALPGRGEVPLGVVVPVLVEGDQPGRQRGTEEREGVVRRPGEAHCFPGLPFGAGKPPDGGRALGERDPGPGLGAGVAVHGRPGRHRGRGRFERGGVCPAVRRHLREQQQIRGAPDQLRGVRHGLPDERERRRRLLGPHGQGAGGVLEVLHTGRRGTDEVLRQPPAGGAESVHLPPRATYQVSSRESAPVRSSSDSSDLNSRTSGRSWPAWP